MADDRGKAEAVKAHLDRLALLCDTGYALAIHIRMTAPSLLYQTYAQDWAEHYSTKGYMMSDPVVRWGLTHTGRVVWDTLTDVDPEGVIAASVSFGLTHGWTYAVGSSSTRTIAGLTRSGRAHTEAEVAEIEAIVDDVHKITDGFDDFPKDLQAKLRRL